jgi:putative ABC transport system permease protein
MIKSYFQIAWRSFLKRRVFSFINIAGLSTGMTVAILIAMWINDEVTFNTNFENHSRLAQVMTVQTFRGESYADPTIAVAIAEPLRNNYADDFKALALTSHSSDQLFSVGDKHVVKSGRWVQHQFPGMFTLRMIAGSRNALSDPSSLLLSSSLANALFGDDDPINKTVRVDNTFDLIVGGVYEDLPANCSFADAHYLIPWENQQNWRRGSTDWDNHNSELYAQLTDHADVAAVSEVIRGLPTPHIQAWKEELTIQAFDYVHLYNEFVNSRAEGGRIQYVWLFGFIVAFVLALACINFMNLSTARSEQRAKEVGIRKTAGSMRRQLVFQFLTESVLLASIASIFALVLTQTALPFFNTLAQKQIVMPWSNPYFGLALGVFIFFTGILAGSYPASYLSSFKPISILRKSFRTGSHGITPRKVLVVFQFTVSVALIIGTLFVYRQIQFAKDRPAGYTRQGLITVWINTPELRQHYEALRTALIQSGAAEHVALSSQSPAEFNNNNGIEWQGKDPANEIFFRNVTVSPDFGKTIGWTIKEGRDFSADLTSDSSSVIVSERAAAIMDMKNPVGEKIKFGRQEYTIIGVVDDMITQSPYAPPEPSFFIMKGWMGVITMRINPATPVREALARIETVFKKYNPNSSFDYGFVDQDFGRKFANETRIGQLAALFAVLAILISCLGMFGLAAFSAEQRTKEIGIRKVLGASVAQLWALLSRDFVVLVAISCAVAIPAATWFMSGGLNGLPTGPM